MLPLLLAVGLDLDPFDLVRVDDPTHPEADARSASGAVLLAPPTDGTPWRWEVVPESDGWIAEEAFEALQVQPWHDRGVTGAGVKVAVFDFKWFLAAADPDELGDFETKDCYAHPSCEVPIDPWRPRFAFEEGAHGLACAEVIHDLAPDARLYLVRVSGQTTLENAVDWAIREQIDVVSMSLSFYNASFYDGSGPISAQVARLYEAGILMVVSAGNTADAHWAGAWKDGDRDGRLDFDGSNGLDVYLSAGSAAGLYLSWDQYRACGRTDLDLRLLDAQGRIVGGASSEQTPGLSGCEPNEHLRGTVAASGWYRLEVLHRGGSEVDVDVDVTATRGSIGASVPARSLADPASSPFVLTVGAVRADGYFTNGPEGFSSWGPSNAGVPKPDLAGPDGLSTAVYGAGGFYGTSAAAPAVAGLVALVLSDDPSLTPWQAARRLQGWAVDGPALLGIPDPRWGAGKARLPEPPEPTGCGGRPLLLPLLLPPLGWWRRRRSGYDAARGPGGPEAHR